MPGRSVRRAVGLVVCVAVAVPGCGDDPKPKTEREQVADVVRDFLRDVVDNDAEAVCATLTPVGRGQAIGLGQTINKPPRPANRDDCVADKAHVATDSSATLAKHQPRIGRTTIEGSSAQVVLINGALRGTQRLRKTSEGWKIEEFSFPIGG